MNPGLPVLAELFGRVALLPEFIELSEDGRGEHVLDVDPAGALGVQEEEELPDDCDHVELHVGGLDGFEVRKSGDELADVALEVVFLEVAIAASEGRYPAES